MTDTALRRRRAGGRRRRTTRTASRAPLLPWQTKVQNERVSTVADALEPFLASYIGRDLPVAIRFWDGSSIGPSSSSSAIVVRSPNAIRRLIYAPGELGLGRSYVTGDIDIEGDVFDVLRLRDSIASRDEHASLGFGLHDRISMLRSARSIGALGLPPPPPSEEARLRGGLHSKRRDAQAIAHHYDVGNDFYRIVLGPTMTYSCAYWERADHTLDDAQAAKYDLICRKLGLREGMRLLDVGCGWGGMVLHAAQHYGVSAIGITISSAQADAAAKRVADAGLAHQVEIRLQDYRDVADAPFDAISSIGMFEHVGLAGLTTYFSKLRSLLRPHGRLLNHAISKPSGKAGFDKNSFISRYVFPDGELQEVGRVVTAMQELGLEVRDVESLREHYARTLRAWVANLEAEWDRAVHLAGPARARIWRLYMAGSALGFEAGRINVHQVLGIKPAADGTSGMPRSRSALLTPTAT